MKARGNARWNPAAIVVLMAALALAGCGRPSGPAGPGPATDSRGPSSYGPPTGVASRDIPRAHPAGPEMTNWSALPFVVLGTDLSPALLVHSAYAELDLFAGSTNAGLGAPTFVAWSTINGPRSFKRGETFDVKQMKENWVLVWWAGAEGWTHWDVPWVAYLHHKPRNMNLDADGLHVEFPGPAGDVVLLPLYGYEKLPQKGQNYLAAHGLTGRKVQTWDWADVLKRDPLTRIRYWGAALREFPLHVEDSFRVDRAADTITLRSRFEWHSIRDDWKSTRLRLAPISPPLGLAAKLGGFPAHFSRGWFDLDLATPYGPYVAVEGVDQFDVDVPVLQYIHETEAWQPPETNTAPILSRALARLQMAAASKFPPAGHYECDGGLTNLCGGAPGVRWDAASLAYCAPMLRERGLAQLRAFVREQLLVPDRFPPPEAAPGSSRVGAGLAGTGDANPWGQATTCGADLLPTLWAYGEASGDWAVLKERWPLVKRLFTSAARTRWAGGGPEGVAELGSAAAASAAFARMAYRLGDMDSYHYACAQFARELLVLFLKQRGAEFFRTHQPWHSMEFMDDEVFVTQLGPDNSGWEFDGPNYPADTTERRFQRRWWRFNDPDVGRFCRDWFPEELGRELNWWQNREAPSRRWENDPGRMPSLVQLRSLLLHEDPAALALVAAPEQFGGTPSGIIANCVAILRTGQPSRYRRLIPAGAPSPFVVGLEREVTEPNGPLLVSVRASETRDTAAVPWPELIWPAWKSPAGAPWSFGCARPGLRTGRALRPQTFTLNWNTVAIGYAEAR